MRETGNKSYPKAKARVKILAACSCLSLFMGGLSSCTFEPASDDPDSDSLESAGAVFNSLPPGKYEPDGVIGHFQQGRIGDCWFLATLVAVNNDLTERGKIEDSIQVVGPATWRVKLPGMKYGQLVTRDELQNYKIGGNNLSYGDGDVRLLEIAVDKHINMHDGDLEKGDWPKKAFWLLTNRASWETRGTVRRLIERRLRQRYDRNKSNGIAFVMYTQDGNDVGYPGRHVGAIVDMDWDHGNFYYINPWDTSKVERAGISALVGDIKNGKMWVRHSKD